MVTFITKRDMTCQAGRVQSQSFRECNVLIIKKGPGLASASVPGLLLNARLTARHCPYWRRTLMRSGIRRQSTSFSLRYRKIQGLVLSGSFHPAPTALGFGDEEFFCGSWQTKIGPIGRERPQIRERDFFAEKTGLILDSLKRTEE